MSGRSGEPLATRCIALRRALAVHHSQPSWLVLSAARWSAAFPCAALPCVPFRRLLATCNLPACCLPPCHPAPTCPLLQDGGAGVDPNRVGGPVNHLLSDGGMSTMIGGGKGVDHGLVRGWWWVALAGARGDGGP